MKEQIFQCPQLAELGVRIDTIKVAPFQGEICTVFTACSDKLGPLVIKTALRNGQLSQEGQREIHQNKEGYDCIPADFRPEVIATEQADNFLVMPNVGKPLRDLLWENQHSPETSEMIVGGFLVSLSQLLSQTRTQDPEARNIFLDQFQGMVQSFLDADFFPRELLGRFDLMLARVRQIDDDRVAFATLDMTQGNLLIDPTKNPQTLKVIDPKKPRLVRGNFTFLGVPEIDLGMFLTTLNLNSPNTIQDLKIERRLKDLGLNNFTFELGKLFGCILVASFPNNTERVTTYFQSVGANWDDDVERLVVIERERHIKKAAEIADNMGV